MAGELMPQTLLVEIPNPDRLAPHSDHGESAIFGNEEVCDIPSSLVRVSWARPFSRSQRVSVLPEAERHLLLSGKIVIASIRPARSYKCPHQRGIGARQVSRERSQPRLFFIACGAIEEARELPGFGGVKTAEKLFRQLSGVVFEKGASELQRPPQSTQRTCLVSTPAVDHGVVVAEELGQKVLGSFCRQEVEVGEQVHGVIYRACIEPLEYQLAEKISTPLRVHPLQFSREAVRRKKTLPVEGA
jgi:hypothetical protein